jgi:hypothetical protein
MGLGNCSATTLARQDINIPGPSDYDTYYSHDVYGYTFPGTAVLLSWAVLLVHVLLVVGHFLVVIVVNKG